MKVDGVTVPKIGGILPDDTRLATFHTVGDLGRVFVRNISSGRLNAQVDALYLVLLLKSNPPRI